MRAPGTYWHQCRELARLAPVALPPLSLASSPHRMGGLSWFPQGGEPRVRGKRGGTLGRGITEPSSGPEGVKILTLRRVIEKKTNVGSSSLLQIPPSSWGTEVALLCREEQEGRAWLLVPGESSAESRYKSIPR